MSEEIICSSESINYVLSKAYQGQSYTTENIILIDKNSHEEPSAGYQEPNDLVITYIYNANSEHGIFKWVVTARRAGFNSFLEIDDIHSFEPNGCESLELPIFSIKHI